MAGSRMGTCSGPVRAGPSASCTTRRCAHRCGAQPRECLCLGFSHAEAGCLLVDGIVFKLNNVVNRCCLLPSNCRRLPSNRRRLPSNRRRLPSNRRPLTSNRCRLLRNRRPIVRPKNEPAAGRPEFFRIKNRPFWRIFMKYPDSLKARGQDGALTAVLVRGQRFRRRIGVLLSV